ncbi:MAG: hypothetical protein FWD56_01920 [Bacteroidales bacterium]|nr:hypothetical protein [Bacteroidales bacterium]
MKIKLLFAAFAAAAVLVSCMGEEQSISTTEGTIKNPTVATFSLKLSNPDTKLFNDFNPDAKNQVATEVNINPADLRLIIIDDDTNIIEINELFGTGTTGTTLSKTVQVAAGPKKIFVIANAGTSSFGTAIGAIAVGANKSALDGVVFDAGTPQFPWTNKTTFGRDFKLEPLYLNSSSSSGLPASNTDQFTYQLKAGVSAATSSGNPGTPVAIQNGNTFTQDNNNFDIKLVFMAAKGRLGYTAGALTNGTIATVTDVKYSIHNLARFTNPIQKVVGTLPQSYYFGKTFDLPFVTGGPHVDPGYGYHFDSGMNTNQNATLVSGTGPYTFIASTPYIYAAENNNVSMTWGQATHFAINAHYRPNRIVTSVDFEPVNTPKLNMNQTGTYPGTGYVYLRKDISGPHGSIESGTCFSTLVLLQQAAWLCYYAENITTGGWTASGPQVTQANALIDPTPPAVVPAQLPVANPNYGYYIFALPNPSNASGGNWYRLAIGEPANSNTYFKYGVFRGKAYEAIVTAFNGPGVPYEWMLNQDPGEPVDAETNVTVVISILEWVVIQIPQPLP